MRAVVCVVVAVVALTLPPPALAQGDRPSAKVWKAVQASCDAAAARPAGELGQRIAKIALDEFHSFGGHQIDADGRLFRFGLTEAEHEQDDQPGGGSAVGHLGWWQVMKYWRAVFPEGTMDKLEVRGYQDASNVTDESRDAALLRTTAAQLLRDAEAVTDPVEREVLREAALRAAAVDTSWSAAFISYVIRQAGIAADAFRFSNAHRVYIYDAFATSMAELDKKEDPRLYRACPATTRPRPGDLLCQQREPALAGLSDQTVRERIRTELGGPPEVRTVRRTHCEVVAYVDAHARKVYTIGGNVNQAVSARKMNLRRDLKFSAVQRGDCGGPGHWTMPPDGTSQGASRCSLNDRKWFVLLQIR